MGGMPDTEWIIVETNLKMCSTASAEGALDVPGPIRGEIIVSLSSALRGHLWLRERVERVGRAVGGCGGQEMRRIKVIADAEQ
jgi:hypothetical protein